MRACSFKINKEEKRKLEDEAKEFHWQLEQHTFLAWELKVDHKSKDCILVSLSRSVD